MKRFNIFLVILLMSATWGMAQKIAAYFPSYRSGVVNSMQWNKLTDVYYAFMNADINGNLITSNPSDAVFGYDAITFDAVKARCNANGVRLHISIGGADAGYLRAARLKDIARNATARTNFATQVVNYAIANGLAGINLDWEFPNESIGGTGGNVTDHFNLVKAVKDRILASSKPTLTLGAAVGGEWFGTFRHTNYVSNATNTNAIALLDEFHIMAYDLPAGGGGSGLPYDVNHHASVANVATSLQEWNLQKGVPYNKMLVGIPFYGRTAARGVGNDIDNMYLNFSASNPAAAFQDADGLFNGWYYDSKTQIDLKIQDAVGSKGCQGAFVWDLGQDRTDQYSLLSAIKSRMEIICPIPDPNLGPDQGFCSGSVTLNPQVPTNAGRTFTWQKDGVNISGLVNSSTANTYSTNQAGTYKVIIRQGTCQKEDEVSVVSGSSFTATNATRCGSGSVTLSVNSSTGTYDWYDAAVGGSKLLTGGSGNNFGRSLTTNVTATSDFFIQVNNGSQDYNTGKAAFDNTPNAAWNERGINDASNKPRFAQRLTLFTDVTLKSVKIYKPSGVTINNAKIIVYKSNGSTIHAMTDSVNLGGTISVHNFNANISLQGSVAGTVYYIGVWAKNANGGVATNPGFFLDRNQAAANYTQAGVFTLNRFAYISFAGDFGITGSETTNYGQLFDFVLTTGVPDPCGRVKATATVNPGADITKTAIPVKYSLCPTDNGTVRILNSELDALYQVVSGTTNIGSPVTGTGSNIDLTVPNNVLLGGANSFNVNVSKVGCGASPLSDTVGFNVTPFPNVGYTVTSPAAVCQGANAVINVNGSQAGRSYQAFSGNTSLGSAVAGTGSAIVLSAGTGSLSIGNNTVLVKVSTGTCPASDLTDTVVVKVSAPVVPTITYNNVNRTFGDAAFALTATSNSTGAITYSVVNQTPTGIVSINSNSGQTTILGAGTATIRASQVANGCFAANTRDVTLTIAKKTLTVTADPQTKVFNTANPTLTVKYAGFVGTDDINAIDTPPTVTTTAVTNSPVGNYPITVSGGLDNNYTFSFVAGTLTVTKATPTLAITSANSGQAGSTINLTASTNSTGAITWTVVSGNGTISGNVLSLTASGSVVVQASLATDANYNAASVQQTITISAQSVPSITFANVSRTYGDVAFAMTASSNSPGALSYSITGGNSFASITSNGQVTILGAGVVTVKVDQASSGTFAAGSATATLTIAKKNLNAKADDKSRNYNSANPAFTISYTGFVGSDNAAGIDVQPTAATTATQTSNAGSYVITLTGGSDNNYNIVNANGTLTVNIIAPTLQITSGSSGQAGTNINLTASTNSTGAISWSVVSGNGTVSGSTLSLTAVGTVVVQASLATDVNYTATTAQQTITITNQTVPTINFTDVNKTFGDAAFNLTTSSNSTGSLSYSITSGNAFATITPNGLVTILGAGTVQVKVDQVASGSFAATSKTATLTIAKKQLSATADNKTRPYNSANPTFTITYSGFVGTDNATVIDVAPTASTTASQTSNQGTYSIAITGGSDNNYTFNYVSGVLTITKIDPTLTITSANSGQAGSTINLVANTNSSSPVTWSVISGNGTISGNVLSLTAQGSVVVQAAVATDINYNAATANQTITISAKTVPVITANNINKTFGDVDFTLPVSSTSSGALSYSVVSGNTFVSINPNGVVSLLGAGNATIRISQAASGVFDAATKDVTIAIAKGTRSVNITSANAVQAGTTLNLTATSSPSSSALTWSVSILGTTNASITGSTLTAGSNAGTVTVKVDVAADANYNAASATQAITVSSLAAPAINFVDQVKTFGDAKFNMVASSNSAGALTYSITSGGSFATIDANSGEVTIIGAGIVTVKVDQAAASTFAASSKTATLTINKATRTVVITSANTAQVGTQVALTATATPSASVAFSVTNGTGSATVSGNQLLLVTKGTVTITASVNADANYLAASGTQVFTITDINSVEDVKLDARLVVSASPNPFENQTQIEVSLPSDAVLTVEVLNLVGASVANLSANENLAAGKHTFDLASLASGTYIVKAIANGQVATTRVVKQ